MGDFWEIAPKENSGTILRGRLGIVCPLCGVKLKVLQTGVWIARSLAIALPLGIAILLAFFSPVAKNSAGHTVRVIGLVALMLGGLALQGRWAPRLLGVRFLRDGEVVDYPLTKAAKEQAEEDQFFEEQREMESPDTGKPGWRCASCGEENPGNFEVCWKCRKERVRDGS